MLEELTLAVETIETHYTLKDTRKPLKVCTGRELVTSTLGVLVQSQTMEVILCAQPLMPADALTRMPLSVVM